MKRALFLGTIALLGLTSIGNATLYVRGHDKNDNLAVGDCLEMMCDYCVEDEEGHGYCCPSAGNIGDSCRDASGVDLAECCGEDKTCQDGVCVGTCPSPLPTYHEICTTGCGCLDEETTGLSCSETTGKCECPEDSPWDPVQQKCDFQCPLPLPSYHEVCTTQCGCFDEDTTGLSCSETTGKCECPADSPWDPILKKCDFQCPSPLPSHDEACTSECKCYNETETKLSCNSQSHKCECPTDYGWDGSKCLPYCTESSGIFLLVDRSGSTFTKGKDGVCDSDKDPCVKINALLEGLDLSDRNYALYNEETGGCGYNQAMSMLTFGQHSSSEYELWKSISYKPKCNDSDGTFFDKALSHINSKYCKKDSPIVIMIITDGEIQKRRDDMASYMNSMIKKCDAKVVYIGPDGSKLVKNMNKNVTNFWSYDFDDSVQDWISGTNKAINGSCIMTDKGKRTASTSDSSWFCNVLSNATDGDSYLHLTEEQCFVCSDQTKFRWHDKQSKWEDVGVCCGKDNTSGACKEKGHDWKYYDD